MELSEKEILDYNISNGIEIKFTDGCYMRFVASQKDYIIRNIYHNATGGYYDEQTMLWDILGKRVQCQTDPDNPKRVIKTFPMEQSENQKFRMTLKWKRIKTAVWNMNRDKYGVNVCEDCHSRILNMAGEVHHLAYYHGDGPYDCDPAQLGLLCRRCHQARHDNIKQEER